MKKIISLLIAICLLATLFISGCGEKKHDNSLSLHEGVLSWETVPGSTYEVDLGGGGEIIKKTSYNLAEKCDFVGTFTVTVRAIDEQGNRTEIGSMELTSSKMQNALIEVVTDEDDLYFSWKSSNEGVSYVYDAHDGKGIQKAKLSEDGTYKVPITDDKQQIITVTSIGTSDKNKLYLSTETNFTYKSSRMFDLALLAQYPCVYVAGVDYVEEFLVGSTLSAGVYDFELSLYLMDAKGYTLTGNGMWGRRIFAEDVLDWYVEKDPDGWPGVSGNIPYSDTLYKTKVKLQVDRGGNIIIPFCDFNREERVVIADIKHNGKSVINNNGGQPNPVEEEELFDVSKRDQYLAYFQSEGTYYVDNKEDSTFTLPLNVKDGNYNIKVTYYTCDAEGASLVGNGLWGRRIAGSEMGREPFAWLSEYGVEGLTPAMELPKATQTASSKFNVDVKNGQFDLIMLDFEEGELFIVTDITVAEKPEKNGVFVSNGQWEEQMKVETTLVPEEGEPRYSEVNLEISYKVYDVYGDALEGNGLWGRRIMDGNNQLFWLCEDKVDGYPEAAKTIPTAGKTVTDEFFVWEINKKGVLTLDLFDFNAGEVVEITKIIYTDKETGKKIDILKK